MMCKEYNGYTNYQTWNVALWLDNEQGTNELLDQIANGKDEYSIMDNDFSKADALQDIVEDAMRDQIEGSGMAADLLGHALANVDWLEIIRTHQED